MFKNVNGVDVKMSPEEVTAFEATRVAKAISPINVRNEGARRLKELFSDYSSAERETWPRQIEEAKALTVDSEAYAPLLRTRSKGRADTLDGLASLVLVKAEAGWNASGYILSRQDELLAMDPIPLDFTDDKYWTIPDPNLESV